MKKIREAKENTEEIKANVKKAKNEVKGIDSPDDVKKFLDKNKSKLDKISSKFKNVEDKKNFDAIVDGLNKYASGKQLNEAKDKAKIVVHGLLAILAWFLTSSIFIGFLVAFAPQISDILAYGAKVVGKMFD